jgi:uncharacterized protein YciI
MQFLILARDGTDPEAPARRASVRPFHLEGAKKLKEQGHLVIGGARLDPGGSMIGSMMVVDFPDRAALDAWLAIEPYATRGVWCQIEVQPFRVASLD